VTPPGGCGGPPSRSRVADVIRALSQLPAKQRAVVVLHDFADRPTEEISYVLNIRRSTVRTHLSEARRRLRSLLEERDG
jgi:RNA polymerase sigma factor (sigma-70 family)